MTKSRSLIPGRKNCQKWRINNRMCTGLGHMCPGATLLASRSRIVSLSRRGFNALERPVVMNLDDIVPSGSSSQRRRSSAAGSDVQREIGSLAHTMRERMNVEIPAGRGGLADRDRDKDKPAGMRGVARNESVYVTLPGVHAQTPRLLCLTGIFRRIPTAEEERGRADLTPPAGKKV
jgi:hypothetical protein